VSWKASFAAAVKEGSSTIGLADVCSIVKACGIVSSEDEIGSLFKDCLSSGSRGIDITEFEVLMKTIKANEGRTKTTTRSRVFSFFKF
jgi:Ca2+-binding EF-hand superfamily protein